MILEKDISMNHFSLIPHPASLTKKVQIFFRKSTKGHSAIIDLIRDCIFLIRFDSTYSLFLKTAVILFYFTICSPLSAVPCQGSYQFYHYVIQSRASSEFYCSPVRVAICPDKSLLLVG